MTDKKIVLTGVSRGIGLETAKVLLEQGAEVLGVSRDAKRLETATVELETLGVFHSLPLDIAAEGAAAQVAAWIGKNWGRLDILINNAGMMVYQPGFEAEGVRLLEKTLQVNLLGAHHLIMKLLPWLRRGLEPRIVNVSSGAGTRESVETLSDMPSYRLSKYALNGLTLLWAKTLQGQVAVNSLDPGWLKTDMGGPQAPGEPIAGAQRILALLNKPFQVTGKVWQGADEVSF